MNNSSKIWLKVGLALLILVELGVAGFWSHYHSEANQMGIALLMEDGTVYRPRAKAEMASSALGWLALVNAVAILFTALYLRNLAKFPVLPLISLAGSIALSIRGVLLSIRELSWLFVIGIVAAIVVGVIAIWTYKKAI